MTDVQALARYSAVGGEVPLVRDAFARRLPVMILGPTGCGKTRLVEHVAADLDVPLITITCHDDLTTADLVGRHLISGGDVEWHDGPLTTALRKGCICYLDEVVEARPDTLAVLHSVADHRRTLYLERRNEEVVADDRFMLVASYNPRVASLKELKASLRQRFVTLRLGYLPAEEEAQVVATESGVSSELAGQLVACANSLRVAATRSPHVRFDPPSTRSLVGAGTLLAAGAPFDLTVEAFLVAPIARDEATEAAIREVVAAALPARE